MDKSYYDKNIIVIKRMILIIVAVPIAVVVIKCLNLFRQEFS